MILRLFICLITSVAFTQQSTDYITYKDLYPDSHLVRLNQEAIVRISLDEDKISIVQDIIEEDLYLNDAATQGSKQSLNFSSFYEIDNLEASTFNFESGRFKEYKVEVFKEKDELDGSFYDDSKSINFVYPNLKKGSKSRLAYSEKIKNPRFLNAFYFGDFFPIAKNKITFIVDNRVNLSFKQFNTVGLSIKFNETKKRKTTIYTWELDNHPEYDYEDNVPTYKKVLPHIIPIIASYELKDGKKKQVLSDVADLYNWYSTLIEDVNTANHNPELVNLVKRLTIDKKSEFEKVKSLYYWTQKNIKYVAFEYALGGFIPREANDVYTKKYGDCKDNSSILSEMLEIAGIKGHITWIGTRKIPYTYTDVPTPIVDNHMILSYRSGGKTYFLDATGRYMPIDIPTSFIQGKESLIEDGASYRIEKVPVIDAEQNALIDSTYISMEGDKIIGKSKVEILGYKKIDFFNRLENVNSEDKTLAFYNAKFRKGNNKFLINNLIESNKFDYDKSLIVNYNFTIKDYAKILGNELYINLSLNRNISEFRTDDSRKNEIEYDYKDFYNYTTVLTIPDGYRIEYMPENINLSNELMTFKIDYSLHNNKITYKQNIKMDFLNLNLTQQKAVNDLIKKAEKSFKEIVVLKKL